MEYTEMNITQQATVMYDGNVSFRHLRFDNGENRELGFMITGEYEFTPEQCWCFVLLNGEVDILLPGETEYKTYEPEQYFVADAGKTFKAVVKEGKFCDFELCLW